MTTATFQPGFRISIVDRVVLVVGSVAAVVAWRYAWWLGFTIGFVVAHFFLFCNIVRMARPLELAWSGVFLALTFGTIVHQLFTWPTTIAGSLLATIIIVAAEMRKPSYHGAMWQRINPGLPQWWERNQSGESAR